MKPFFAIAPWEYPGASFEPTPHAIVRHEVAGKKRKFWLKMRDGVIYFREAERIAVFAVPRIFDVELATDSEKLVHEWKSEMERDNYGAFIISHRKWSRTLAAANYCLIIRTNGSGWVKEHFDEKWLEFSIPYPHPLLLWHSQFACGGITSDIINHTKALFLNRAVDSAHFQTVLPHWSQGSAEEMIGVLRSAAHALIPAEELPRGAHECRCKSNSAFQAGSVTAANWGSDSYRYSQIWDIAKWHYGFVGVEWKRASDRAELQAEYGPEVWRRGFEKWGENWRGNWIGHQYETQLAVPPFSDPSQHEKLEAVLTLREFLHDKMPTDKVESLLKEVLND